MLIPDETRRSLPNACYQKAIKTTTRKLFSYTNLLWLFLLFGLSFFDN